MFQSWLNAYEWTLDKVIAYKLVTLIVAFATIFGTVWLYIAIPKGFFPQNTGFVPCRRRSAVRTFRSPAMVEHQRKVADVHPRRSGGGLRQLHRRRGRSKAIDRQPGTRLRSH